MEIFLQVVGTIPWMIVALGLWLMWTAWRFSTRAIGVGARVVDLNEERIPPRRPSGKETILRRPVFEYLSPDGSPRRAESFAPGTGYKLTVGDEVQIWIDPDLPEIARLQSWAIYGPGLMITGFGLATAIAAATLGTS